MKYIALLSLLAGCGIHVTADKVQSDPVQVIHTFNINLPDVLQYCQNRCIEQNAYDLDACTADCYSNFLDLLMAGAK